MPKALLIYNPCLRRAKDALGYAIACYRRAGWDLRVYRSNAAGDIPRFFKSKDLRGFDLFLAAGGDGTVNEIAAGMQGGGYDKPLGIVPCGTVNDFARCLKLPSRPDRCIDLFLKGRTRRVDLGSANGRCFLNVCAAGLFSHGYMSYSPAAKELLGRYAYYAKAGISALTFRPSRLRLEANGKAYTGLFSLVMALNSTGTGGFGRIAPAASASDGLLDVVAVKSLRPADMPRLFFKLNAGTLQSDPRVLSFQTSALQLQCLDDSPYFKFCDLDGDRAPGPPLSIAVLPSALTVLC